MEANRRPEREASTEVPDLGTASLSVPDDYVPRRGHTVLEIDMGDGLILFDDDSSLVHHLNPSATLIWQLCDGRGTVAQLSTDIAAEYGLDPADVKRQVGEVVAEFDALELVEDARALNGSDGRPTSHVVEREP